MQQMKTNGWQSRTVVVAMALGVAFAVALPVWFTVVAGEIPYAAIVRSFPGYGVATTAAVLGVIADGAALVSVGALVSVLFLRDLPPREARSLPDGPDLTTLRIAANVWAVSAGALVFIGALDSSGVPVGALADPAMVDYLLAASSNPGALVIRFAAATVVAMCAVLARRWPTLVVGLWAATFGVLTPIAVGQVLVGPSHDLGGDAATIQAVVGYPLLGALVVLGICHLCGHTPSPTTWRRLLRIALVALPVMIVTDAVITWFKLAGSPLLATMTGWFIVGRWIALALVVVAVALAFPLRRTPSARATTVLALGALGAAGWVGFSVAMTRQPPPQYFVDTSVGELFMGFDTLEPPTALVLLTHWRLNLLFFALAVAAVTGYLVAVRAARSKGVEWPLGRTIAWILGWATVVVATSSGLGKYSAPHFGIHMIMHMTLSMLAPVLLSLGGVVTLGLRASRTGAPAQGLHAWITQIMGSRVLRVLYNPLIAFTLFISSYYALYLTDLFGTLMRYHWGHQLMNLHFLLVGYLYYSLILGVDRAPKPLPHIAKLGLAMAAMPFHAFFGVILMNGRSIIAEPFYRYLDLPWADLAAAQELGGGVAWAGGEIPSLIVVVALGIQWARQDRKEAQRIDRHLDTGRDNEFEEYNRMLQQLAERDRKEADR